MVAWQVPRCKGAKAWMAHNFLIELTEEVVAAGVETMKCIEGFLVVA